jgi:hypothetical protein
MAWIEATLQRPAGVWEAARGASIAIPIAAQITVPLPTANTVRNAMAFPRMWSFSLEVCLKA